ncbi:MAG: (2Fe-2S)-binding protein [Acidobacteriota bacterium]
MKKTSNKKGKTYTRRAFLQGLGGGAAGAALAAQLKGQQQIEFPPDFPPPTLYSTKTISFTLNGRKVSVEVEPRETLLDVLRMRSKLTGAKKTCDRGECGGCTVLLDGQAVYSCLLPAVRADGRKVMTIEGLAEGETLHPLQQAFIENDGYQCGFCTPGFVMASVALLNKTPAPSLAEIKAGLSGNICRCGSYVKIYEAVSSASQKMRKA